MAKAKSANKTYFANTKYGFVKRTSASDYKNWCMIVIRSYDGCLLASVSFHKRGNIQKCPSDAVYYDCGEVSEEPDETLQQLKKRDESPWYGWIVLPNL